MLDATKAFDRVEYCKLFRQLMSREIPPIVIRLLLNMYINHTTRITWNGIFSDRFSIKNGVKQGGILSPVLFCIYFDGLLCKLSKAGIGCFIGNFFVGALAYADDLVLLAPTPHAMRAMLAVCESYANEFSVAFNANKSKCIIIRAQHYSRHDSWVNSFTPSFHVGGKLIEFVDNWPHLGHIITNTMSDISDITSRRNSLVGQINNVLCYFSNLETVTKVKLLKAYCSSFYGCELWDFWEGGVENFCKAWRQGQRAVWKLPFNTHRRFLPLMCDSLPVEDEICRRFLSFLRTCVSSQCELVQFIVRHGLLYGGMFSLSGRNAMFCSNRFGFTVGDIFNPDFHSNIVKNWCIEARTVEDLDAVSVLLELTFIRDGIFLAPPGLSRVDINEFISSISVI
jgi:hypothetical protein